MQVRNEALHLREKIFSPAGPEHLLSVGILENGMGDVMQSSEAGVYMTVCVAQHIHFKSPNVSCTRHSVNFRSSSCQTIWSSAVSAF